MLNFSTSNPVSWPTPQSIAVPPTTAVVPVQATQGAGRDAQAGLGAGQDRSTARRERDEAGAKGTTDLKGQARQAVVSSSDAEGTAARRAVEARKAAEAEAVAEAEARVEAKQDIHEMLQEVLSNVWQASAAVVDRALGRQPTNDAAVSLDAAAGTRRAMLVAPPEMNAPPGEQGLLPTEFGPTQSPAPEDLVAYDEKGNGSVPTPEAGTLVDQRV